MGAALWGAVRAREGGRVVLEGGEEERVERERHAQACARRRDTSRRPWRTRMSEKILGLYDCALQRRA